MEFLTQFIVIKINGFNCHDKQKDYMDINHIKLRLCITTLFVIFVGLSGSVFAKNIYTLESINENGVIKVSLSLPSSQGPIFLKARGVDWGLQPQIDNMYCDNVLTLQQEKGVWRMPAKCKIASWEVYPNTVKFGNADASRQESIFIPGTTDKNILFSESTSLARIIDEDDAILTTGNDIKLLGATKATQENSQASPSWMIPAYKKAPEFYLIGDLQFFTSELTDLNVTYFSDNPFLTDELHLNEFHKKAIGFLLDSIPEFKEKLASEKINLLVVWLGSNAQNNFIGGAAGYRSFVSNYLYSDNVDIQKNNLKTLTVITHEQFHQLIELIRGNNEGQPVWIEEGLAQYYGLKALNNIHDPNNQDVSEITSSFINKNKPIDFSFTELNKQFKEGNNGVYPLFYTQGATFWSMLDAALLEGSQGRYGLDESICLLIRSKPDEKGGLPVEYERKIVEIGGGKVKKLIDMYVEGKK